MADIRYTVNKSMRVAQVDSGRVKSRAQASWLPPPTLMYHLCWLRGVPCMKLRTEVSGRQPHAIWFHSPLICLSFRHRHRAWKNPHETLWAALSLTCSWMEMWGLGSHSRPQFMSMNPSHLLKEQSLGYIHLPFIHSFIRSFHKHVWGMAWNSQGPSLSHPFSI